MKKKQKIKNIIFKKIQFKNIEIQILNFRFDHALRLVLRYFLNNSPFFSFEIY